MIVFEIRSTCSYRIRLFLNESSDSLLQAGVVAVAGREKRASVSRFAGPSPVLCSLMWCSSSALMEGKGSGVAAQSACLQWQAGGGAGAGGTMTTTSPEPGLVSTFHELLLFSSSSSVPSSPYRTSTLIVASAGSPTTLANHSRRGVPHPVMLDGMETSDSTVPASPCTWWQGREGERRGRVNFHSWGGR